MSLERINLQSLVANAMGKLAVSLKVGIMGTKEKRNVDKVEYYKVESCVLIAPIVQVTGSYTVEATNIGGPSSSRTSASR